MKQKLFALLLCMVFICTLSLPVYADAATTDSDAYSVLISDIPTVCPTCGAKLYATWASTSGAEVEVQISAAGSIKIPAGAGSFAHIKLRCDSCGYEKSETRLLGLDFGHENPGNLHVEKVPTGIGRKDLPGYVDDNGTSSVYGDGSRIINFEPYGLCRSRNQIYSQSLFIDGDTLKSKFSSTIHLFQDGFVSGIEDGYYTYLIFKCDIPSAGIVSYGKKFGDTLCANYSLFYNSQWTQYQYYFNGGTSDYTLSYTVDASTTIYYCYLIEGRWGSYKCSAYSVPFTFEALGTTNIINNKTITINNNTWNGNIYTDNSTNLTYIYPQYTTVNEKNETVTNISTNPIIYNNETKQYYTYDQTTKNYYYITYNAQPTPSSSPTPAPTDKPGGSISTPETGKPGGSSGGSGSSWWEKLLDKLGSALIDGLLGAISAVLKLIFKLLSTILGWIIWLVSQVLTLFPFLPPGLGALLIGGVVVCFVIGIIKFIRG